MIPSAQLFKFALLLVHTRDDTIGDDVHLLGQALELKRQLEMTSTDSDLREVSEHIDHYHVRVAVCPVKMNFRSLNCDLE